MKRSLALAIGFVLALSLGGIGIALAKGEKGYLGVFLSVAQGDGAVVLKVVPGGPAEKAGLKVGDRILSAAGEAVKGPADLSKAVQSRSAGDSLELTVERGTESLTLKAALGAFPKLGEEGSPGAAQEESEPAFLGIGFAPVHPALGAHLGLEEGAGLTVGEVWKDSAAAKAGLEKNDVIASVEGKSIAQPEQLVDALLAKRPGDTLKLEVFHKGERKAVEVTLGKRPADLPRHDDRFMAPGAAGRFPSLPEHGRRGRITLERPDGSKHSFSFPDVAWDFESFMKRLEEHFPEMWNAGPPGEMPGRLKKLFEAMKEGDRNGAWSESSSSSAVVRIVEGGYDVTVKEENGVKTVDVKKGDEVIAQNLPYEKIGDLSPEVRERVEKAAKSIKVVPARPLVPAPQSSDQGLKA